LKVSLGFSAVTDIGTDIIFDKSSCVERIPITQDIVQP
jgi:hypothetical protein